MHLDPYADDPERELWFVDPRTFGEVVVFDPDNVAVELPELANLGVDPIAGELTLPMLRRLLRSRHRLLKPMLLDQHVMCGVGNVYRCEVLWATELSPWAHVGDLTHHDALLVVNTAARMLRSNLHHAQRVTAPSVRGGIAVYGRNGQGCPRCHETIQVRRVGEHARLLYWCPGCQVRLDRRHAPDTREMDPHPAAAKFLAELPWRRTAG